MIRSALIAAVLVIASAALPSPAQPTQVSLVHVPVDVNIPSQPVAAALVQLSRQTNVQIVTANRELGDMRSNAVSGRLSPVDAIGRMLENTALEFEVTGRNTIAVKAKEGTSGTGRQPQNPIQLAQAQTPSAGAGEVTAQKRMEEILVTARNPQSTLAQGVIERSETGPLPFQVITREEIERSGATSAPDLMRNLPQNYARGTSAQVATGNPQGTVDFTATNLRGFGLDQTLVLLNDRRLAGPEGNGPNSLLIPLSAVERVEILGGAASAFYGANALGGVVNYVLRNDFEGAEVSGHFGQVSHGGMEQMRASLITGQRFLDRRLTLLIAGEAGRQDALRNSDRDYVNEVMRRRLERASAALFASPPVPDAPPNIRVTTGNLGIPGSTASIATTPANYDGINRGPGTYAATAGIYNLSRNFGAGSNETALAPQTDDYKLFAQAIYAPRQTMALFMEFLFSRANRPRDDSHNRAAVNATVTAANPYNPFGRTVQVGFVPLDVVNFIESYSETKRWVGGVKGVFGADWRWSADVTLWDERDVVKRRNVNAGLLTAALNSSDPARAYNPFADLRTARPNSAAVIDSVQDGSFSYIDMEQAVASARVAGTVLALPAGRIKVSGGVERREFKHSQPFFFEKNPATTNFVFNAVDRSANSVFGELVAPLVSSSMSVPLVHSLDLSGALRYDRFSGSASSSNTTSSNPVIATQYFPVTGFALRASYGTGFYPPITRLLAADPTILPIPALSVTDPGAITRSSQGSSWAAAIPTSNRRMRGPSPQAW